LALAIAPPPNETPEERRVREAREAEAQRVSDEIDERLKKEREGEKKKKRPVKLLLLGEPFSSRVQWMCRVDAFEKKVRVRVARLRH
jgi:guanine nucleotide-binding protein alpha-1 subunit